jgi:chorismate synthase
MSNIGTILRVTTFGESHGTAVGCIIENFPPQIKISKNDIQYQLDRRKPNQNSLLSTRNEPDLIEICSGIQEGVSLGTPICLMVKNIDMKPGDYKSFSQIPRPGHADFTYLSKYGVKSNSGGGRSSARETVARVAAGSLAEIYLKLKFNTEIVSWVNSVGDVEIPKDVQHLLIKDDKIDKKEIDLLGSFSIFFSLSDINTNHEFILYNNYIGRFFYINLNSVKIIELFDIEKISSENDLKYMIYNDMKFQYSEIINIRCPHPETAAEMIKKIMIIKNENDSIGGTVSCVIRNCPRSLGEPCFDKFEAELAKAMLSIPATKGFEIGSGFEGTKMK